MVEHLWASPGRSLARAMLGASPAHDSNGRAHCRATCGNQWHDLTGATRGPELDRGALQQRCTHVDALPAGGGDQHVGGHVDATLSREPARRRRGTRAPPISVRVAAMAREEKPVELRHPREVPARCATSGNGCRDVAQAQRLRV